MITIYKNNNECSSAQANSDTARAKQSHTPYSPPPSRLPLYWPKRVLKLPPNRLLKPKTLKPTTLTTLRLVKPINPKHKPPQSLRNLKQCLQPLAIQTRLLPWRNPAHGGSGVGLWVSRG